MRFFYLLYFSFWIFISPGIGQGINFFEGTWEEAKELAASQKKLIFVDAFAKWCGPCKRMASQVFTNPSVGSYYNDNFINLKIDMEEGMGLSFRQQYPVSAFPTLFYIDEKGEVVKKIVGGKSANDFIEIGKSIIASYDRSGQYVERYEKGERDFDLVLEYVKALNQANKSSLKVANDFLRNNPDLPTDQKSLFLFESLTNADSRLFTLFIEDLDRIRQLKSESEINGKIESACWNTVYNAISFEVKDLLAEAQNKMDQYLPAQSKAFRLKSDYEFAQAINDIKWMSSTALNMSKELYKNDAEELVTLAEELMLYHELYPDMANTAEVILAQAVKTNSDNPEYRLAYSKVLLANNKKSKALKEAEKALKKTSESDRCYDELEELIQKIKAS